MTPKRLGAFWSYAHADDEHDRGRLLQLRALLEAELHGQGVDDFAIWHDRNDISWGHAWRDSIESGLEGAVFFIPVLSPNWFRSKPCRDEAWRFIRHEEERGEGQLILPLLYLDAPRLWQAAEKADADLAAILQARQFERWPHRHIDQETLAARETITGLATAFADRIDAPAALPAQRAPDPAPPPASTQPPARVKRPTVAPPLPRSSAQRAPVDGRPDWTGAWASAWDEDRYGAWQEFTLGDATQRLRWIPSGSFTMGSPPDEDGRDDDEGPQHRVTLTKGFWLFDTPVTQGLWTACGLGNQSEFQNEGARRPVENVSWQDALGFLTVLAHRIDFGDLQPVLPTEAQWEYACRAGTMTPYSFGPGLSPVLANYDESGIKETKTVGSYPSNKWGLYDMHGNVWEWCADALRDYQDAPATDPRGALDSKESSRVIRGGSWFGLARFVRATYRSSYVPGDRIDNLGFRCALVQAGAEDAGAA
ncbi:MAG: SUMF1/EgtB/PvdO family nonheme iron enzyme [Alphaproteobacteria bacterium]